MRDDLITLHCRAVIGIPGHQIKNFILYAAKASAKKEKAPANQPKPLLLKRSAAETPVAEPPVALPTGQNRKPAGSGNHRCRASRAVMEKAR